MTERSMRERLFAGEEYRWDSEIGAIGGRAARLAEAYNRTSTGDHTERQRILAELLGSVGDEVEIRTPFHVDLGQRITVGDRVFANYGLVALDIAPIVIGADTQIGPNVQLLTPTHPLDPVRRRERWESAEPITIGENVWLGGGVIVCPGVTIGDDTVVGAGSVVTRDLPAAVVAVGNPARVVKSIDGTSVK